MESIINDLRYYTGKFPEQALKEAIANQTEITPLLLASLDELLANAPLATKDENYMLHIYCFFLLAQFREKKAFSRIIELISWPADDVDKLFGYGVIEDLASFLFSTYDGNQSALEDIVENTAIYFWARDAVLKVLGKLCLIGEISRDYVVDFLRKMMVNAQAHNSREQVNVSILVQTVIAECGLIEMLPDIKVLYEERQIDLLYFGDYENFASIVKQWDGGSEVYYIEDIISEMQWWSCFQTDFLSYPDQSFIRIPVARAIPKVGRNEPCPCGSGKKYKKCCGK